MHFGGFRVSELLCEFRREFNPRYALMPSDILVEENSLSFWLRSEKVPSRYGNVVEVWRLPEREDLDPVIAMKLSE